MGREEKCREKERSGHEEIPHDARSVDPVVRFPHTGMLPGAGPMQGRRVRIASVTSREGAAGAFSSVSESACAPLPGRRADRA